MEELEEKVLNTISKYNLIDDGDKVVLGVSGGPDSITMLDILNNFKNSKKIKFEICIPVLCIMWIYIIIKIVFKIFWMK